MYFFMALASVKVEVRSMAIPWPKAYTSRAIITYSNNRAV